MSALSQSTPTFSAETYQIRLSTNGQPAFVEVGNSPTATANSMLVGANCIDYITTSPGQAAAVLQAGTGGVISITEMS